ncbi:MAG: dehypoxanthinylfutalosine cyclase [Pseudomonadota bacterium]
MLEFNEALKLYQNEPFIELGKAAYAEKKKRHKYTTFVVDRNINYTNICVSGCKFCAFKKEKSEDGGYVLSFDDISAKIEELISVGGTQILFQGGVHPDLDITYYEKLVDFIHKKYPSVTVHGFSASEIDFIAKKSNISIEETLKRLQAMGLFSIPGAGAEILVDRVRKIISPKKIDSAGWIKVHRAAHKLGIKSTATMMFGSVETEFEQIEHLEKLRLLQDETEGFRAFIMWSFQPTNTPLSDEYPDIKKASSNRYLRLLALARLYLDNFDNIQSSWVTQGGAIGQTALFFGANDMGSTMMEENVVASAGAAYKMAEDDIVRVIQDAGEIAAQRTTDYKIIKTYGNEEK